MEQNAIKIDESSPKTKLYRKELVVGWNETASERNEKNASSKESGGRKEKEIGRGSHGTVFLGMNNETGSLLAIKGSFLREKDSSSDSGAQKGN